MKATYAISPRMIISVIGLFVLLLVASLPGATQPGLARAQDTSAPSPQVTSPASDAGNTQLSEPARPYVVLYDQYDNQGIWATNSQNYESSRDAYDDQLADDFVVSGAGWTINEVDVAGRYANGNPAPGGPARNINVVFYNDASGLPGAIVTTRNNMTFSGPGTTGAFVINISPVVALAPGHYWMSVQVNMDYGAPTAGQWYWIQRRATSNSPAAWRNPGGGSGVGCTTWGTRTSCLSNGTDEPDQMFRLIGTSSSPTPTPTPPPVTITDLELSQPHYRGRALDPDWVQLTPGGIITDGNVIKVQLSIRNQSTNAQTVSIFISEDTRDTTIHEILDRPIPSGETWRVVCPQSPECLWDTSGYAWGQDANGNPSYHPDRQIIVSVYINHQLVTYHSFNVSVVPKPVILVSGCCSGDAQDYWRAYLGNQGFLGTVTPDWKGYAIPIAPTDSDQDYFLNMYHTPTKRIYQNALVVDHWVEIKRKEWNAWHVDIVAHSMGGLVSRKYIQVHMPDINPPEIRNGPVVSHLIMLGTPNLGTPCGAIATTVFLKIPYIPDPLHLTSYPAMSELIPEYVRGFNMQVHDSRNVPFTALAGNASDACSRVVGDGAVPLSSAHGQLSTPITDMPTTQVNHKFMPGNQEIFTSVVRRRLAGVSTMAADAPKENTGTSTDAKSDTTGATGATGATDDSDNPQVLMTDARQVPAGGTVDVLIQVPVGTAFGVTLFNLQGTTALFLRDPNGTTVDQIDPGSPRSTEIFKSLVANNPTVGTWTLRVQNMGTDTVEAMSTAWIEGNPLRINLTVGDPTGDSHVPLTANLTNNGSPVTGATVEVILRDAYGANVTLNLADTAGNGVYLGTANLPSHQLYGVVVTANVAGTQRITTGVVDTSNTATPTPSPTPTLCSMNFTDVQTDNPFYQPIRYLYCGRIISGYGSTFLPGNSTTRGQLSKIIVLARGWPLSCPSTPHFADVPTDNVFYCFVETAYARGLISGYDCGAREEPCPGLYFRSNDEVSRGQLSKIIVLAMGWTLQCPSTPHFTDVPRTSVFYCAIETAYSHGVISGYSDGTFQSNNSATRGQISKIVYQAVTHP